MKVLPESLHWMRSGAWVSSSMVGPTVGDVETLSALGGQLGKLMLSLRRFRSRLTGIVLGGCLAVGACGGGSGGGTPTTPTSPSGGGANAETPGFLDILDRTFQVRTRASYAPSVPPHDGYSWEFRDQTRPGRLTVNVNWEPAATRVRLRLVRNENFPGNRGCVNLPEAALHDYPRRRVRRSAPRPWMYSAW